MIIDELRNFWSKYNEYELHPQDEKYLKNNKNNYCLDIAYEEVIKVYGNELKSDLTLKEFEKNKSYRNKILTNLLAVPFFGDIVNAKIYILIGNPGFHTGDYLDEHKNSDYIKLVKENLKINSKTFIPLHPEAVETGGYKYWSHNGRIPKIAKFLTNSNNKNYSDNYKKVKDSVCIIESIAYHSCNKPSNDLYNLPSSILTKRLVNEHVQKKVLNNEALCFVWRSASFWNVEEHKNVIVREPKMARLSMLFDKEVFKMIGFLENH